MLHSRRQILTTPLPQEIYMGENKLEIDKCERDGPEQILEFNANVYLDSESVMKMMRLRQRFCGKMN